jgi:hypothetical protein
MNLLALESLFSRSSVGYDNTVYFFSFEYAQREIERKSFHRRKKVLTGRQEQSEEIEVVTETMLCTYDNAGRTNNKADATALPWSIGTFVVDTGGNVWMVMTSDAAQVFFRAPPTCSSCVELLLPMASVKRLYRRHFFRR